MSQCSLSKELEIVEGDIEDYKRLARYHYRDSRLGAFDKIYVLRPKNNSFRLSRLHTAGVIVYTMPLPGVQLRRVATEGMFSGFDRATGLSVINKNIRNIGRVIIEPRFRALGLATKLVRETMPKMGVPVIEALAVMGHINPFFARAGMTAYKGSEPARCVQLKEAFSMVGIEEDELVDAESVHKRINALSGSCRDFIERQMADFIQCYGKRRRDEPSLERTRFILSKLTRRPVYYIWLNENIEVGV